MFKQSPISIDDDFFLDLRGHSFFAAQAVTELRKQFPGVSVSVPDFYEYRTVRRLAEFLDKAGAAAKPIGMAAALGAKPLPGEQAAAVDAARPPLPRFRWVCVPLQALALVVLYAIMTAPVFAAIVLILRVLAGQTPLDEAISLATTAGFLIWPTWLIISIAMKWLVIGRYKAGYYPVWGSYYFRWWLATRFQELSLSGIFVGTPLMALYYRAMGAKVGRNCSIDTPHCFAFDLISIGNDTSIGPESQLTRLPRRERLADPRHLHHRQRMLRRHPRLPLPQHPRRQPGARGRHDPCGRRSGRRSRYQRARVARGPRRGRSRNAAGQCAARTQRPRPRVHLRDRSTWS